MKKLLPLLLIGVTAMFFSCESYDKSEGKGNAPAVSFETAQQVLPFLGPQMEPGKLTVRVLLDKPASQPLTIPFSVQGNATENWDFEFSGLPEDRNDEEYYVKFPRGETVAEFTMEHLKLNAEPLQVQFVLQRSSDDSYQLGLKKQTLITVAQRENVKLGFAEDTYVSREFSLVRLSIKLTGEQTGTEYRAPADLAFNIRVVPEASLNQPEITNTKRNAWDWDDNSAVIDDYTNQITVEKGASEATMAMRIRYINAYAPGDELDPDPIFTRHDDWPEGYNYRFGVTFDKPTNGFVFGGEIDTTYVYIKRINNAIEELLMPYKWINPTYGLDLDYASSRRSWLQGIMEITGDDSWDKMPRKHDFYDGFEFYIGDPISGNTEKRYMLKVNANQPEDPTKAYNKPDTVNFSDFAKFFKTGRIFGRDEGGIKYADIGLDVHPLRHGVPAMKFKFTGNSNFLWSRVSMSEPNEKDLPAGRTIMIIPSAVMGDEDESFIDVIIYGGQWYTDNSDVSKDNARRGLFMEKTHMYQNPLNPDNYPYRGNRIYDIWYRLYRDKSADVNP